MGRVFISYSLNKEHAKIWDINSSKIVHENLDKTIDISLIEIAFFKKKCQSQ